MAAIEDIKDFILDLPQKEKDKLLIKLLKKSPDEINNIFYQKLADKEDVNDLIEQLKEEIKSSVYAAEFRRGILEKNLAKGISEASKNINRYKAVLGPEREIALLLHLLEIIFQDYGNEFGTCWTVYDHRVAQTLSKVMTLFNKKIHPDYRIEFESKINDYLLRLKRVSSHLDYVYDLPDKVSI